LDSVLVISKGYCSLGQLRDAASITHIARLIAHCHYALQHDVYICSRSLIVIADHLSAYSLSYTRMDNYG